MSFDVRGFLSPDLDRWREKVRAGFPKRFALLDEVSDLGQRCLRDMCAMPPQWRESSQEPPHVRAAIEASPTLSGKAWQPLHDRAMDLMPANRIPEPPNPP
jgi:hypothetical protein